MTPVWVLVIFIAGVNFTVWGLIGITRAIEGRLHAAGRRRRGRHRADGNQPGAASPPVRVRVTDVAVLMAAHNEELVIADSLAAIRELVPARNIHVVSDGSRDRTVEIAGACGVNVIETPSNVGKAGALDHGIATFGLAEHFGVVLLLDADTRLDPRYFDAALPLFDDPDVVAVAGCAATDWASARRTFAGLTLTAHRSRVYALMQRLVKFGQAWRRTNAVSIVPGFASMYRARVLPSIDINPPGLVIEDFNMTFEVYRKRLGKVGFCLRAKAVTQDPDCLHDYVRQTKRWALGFWQTVRRFRPRFDLFSAMLGLFIAELVTASLMMLALPLIVLLLLLPDLIPALAALPVLGPAHEQVSEHLALHTIALGTLVPDYLLTLAVALTERRPKYLLFGVLFLPLRVIDAGIALYTMVLAWCSRSNGRWKSPQRRRTQPSAITKGAEPDADEDSTPVAA